MKKLILSLVIITLSNSVKSQTLTLYSDVTGGFNLMGEPAGMINLDVGVLVGKWSIEANPTISLLDGTGRIGATLGYWTGERGVRCMAFRPYAGVVYGSFYRMKSVGISPYTGNELFEDYLNQEVRATAGLKMQSRKMAFDIRFVSNPYEPYLTTVFVGVGFSISEFF
jgi:hypothetical protein